MADIALGQVVATRGVADWAGESVSRFACVIDAVERHRTGDYGTVCEADRETNRHAAEHGERVLSQYEIGSRRVWVITEWDRSLTTVLFPEEY